MLVLLEFKFILRHKSKIIFSHVTLPHHHNNSSNLNKWTRKEKQQLWKRINYFLQTPFQERVNPRKLTGTAPILGSKIRTGDFSRQGSVTNTSPQHYWRLQPIPGGRYLDIFVAKYLLLWLLLTGQHRFELKVGSRPNRLAQDQRLWDGDWGKASKSDWGHQALFARAWISAPAKQIQIQCGWKWETPTFFTAQRFNPL